jgi:acyl dehydratase
MAEIDRSLLGVWGPPSTMRVELGKIREFAKAVKDPSPAYRDGDAPIAPPTFLMTIAHWIGDLGATRSAVKLDYRRLLHGEQEFEYVRPIRAGDTLTFRSCTKDVYEKAGKRGGSMLFVVGETEFTNQRGEVVAYMRNVAIETAGAVKG